MPGPSGTYVENFPAVQPVSFDGAQHVVVDSMPAGGASTDVSDRAARVLGKISIDQTTPGTTNGVQVNNTSLAVTGTFWQTTQPVSGTFWQTTQPVSIASMPSTPVTGTFWQATQPVSGTFWQATQPVSGTFWQATQPISAAALPLPSGASTSAKQPALGTAGSASADVLSVQGIASMTALKVDGSAVTQPVSGTFWQATQPVSGTVTANAGTNLNTSALALDATLTGNNARARITDGTNLAAVKAASTAPVATDPALVVAWSPNMAPSSVSLLPSAAASINATVVKATAGRLFKIKGYNAAAAVRYLKFWNKATTPAPASDAATIVFSFALKAADQFDIDLTPLGFAFSTGIGYALTTGSANTDVAALTAADVVGLNVMYA
jgi:hypothetical protein